MHDFGSDGNLRSDAGAYTLTCAVNAEKVRSFAAYAQHEAFSPDIHAIILIRDAISQWRDLGIGSVPSRYLLQNMFDALIHYFLLPAAAVAGGLFVLRAACRDGPCGGPDAKSSHSRLIPKHVDKVVL
jgi:hypothetical protein